LLVAFSGRFPVLVALVLVAHLPSLLSFTLLVFLVALLLVSFTLRVC
jgi:hypothetical protein